LECSYTNLYEQPGLKPSHWYKSNCFQNHSLYSKVYQTGHWYVTSRNLFFTMQFCNFSRYRSHERIPLKNSTLINVSPWKRVFYRLVPFVTNTPECTLVCKKNTYIISIPTNGCVEMHITNLCTCGKVALWSGNWKYNNTVLFNLFQCNAQLLDNLKYNLVLIFMTVEILNQLKNLYRWSLSTDIHACCQIPVSFLGFKVHYNQSRVESKQIALTFVVW